MYDLSHRFSSSGYPVFLVVPTSPRHVALSPQFAKPQIIYFFSAPIPKFRNFSSNAWNFAILMVWTHNIAEPWLVFIPILLTTCHFWGWPISTLPIFHVSPVVHLPNPLLSSSLSANGISPYSIKRKISTWLTASPNLLSFPPVSSSHTSLPTPPLPNILKEESTLTSSTPIHAAFIPIALMKFGPQMSPMTSELLNMTATLSFPTSL